MAANSAFSSCSLCGSTGDWAAPCGGGLCSSSLAAALKRCCSLSVLLYLHGEAAGVRLGPLEAGRQHASDSKAAPVHGLPLDGQDLLQQRRLQLRVRSYHL